MEDNVAIRLKGFMDAMELTNSQFADQCGIPRPTLSQLLTGRNKKISDVLVGQIHSAFPRLSVLWLLFGEGDMLVPDPNSTSLPSEGDDLFTEEFTNAINDTDKLKYSNLKGLTEVKNTPQSAVNNLNNLDLKNLELQREIEKMRKNPRKVTQIMVYYDDSTFETFYPGK
ncbi:MAG: helix-turn-helix domain-containing protein [Muribaculaceae bacterium]|nr:helix-turn-helix domain-containing protein [Muribaculaceae bacterium]